MSASRIAGYPKGTRKIDAALTDMRGYLDWLRTRRSPSGHQWHESDLAREVGFTEAMDMLARYGARIVDPGPAEAQP